MVDWSKPIQTMDDRLARVVCTDKKGGEYPVVVLVTERDGEETLFTYTSDGKFFSHSFKPILFDTDDIINVPAKPMSYLQWVNSHTSCGLREPIDCVENYANYRVQFDRDHRDQS